MSTIAKLGKALLGVAPAAASVLIPGAGGAIASAAIGAIAKGLGCDPDPDTVLARVEAATPDQLVALRQADHAFEIAMREADVDLARIHGQDRASARRMQARTRSWTAPVLACVVVLGFLASVGGVFWMFARGTGAALDEHPAMLTLLGGVIGYVSAKADQVVSYYFGSSEQSVGDSSIQDAIRDATR